MPLCKLSIFISGLKIVLIVSANLCLACEKCNIKKGTQDIEKLLAKKQDILKRILVQAKRPLKDAAALNSTPWTLFNRLKKTGLSVSTGSGGQTKFNRMRLKLPKTLWIDVACVGQVGELEILTNKPLPRYVSLPFQV